VRTIVQQELGWSDERWLREANDYQRVWQAYYAPV